MPTAPRELFPRLADLSERSLAYTNRLCELGPAAQSVLKEPVRDPRGHRRTLRDVLSGGGA
jgi:hypothetical protein